MGNYIEENYSSTFHRSPFFIHNLKVDSNNKYNLHFSYPYPKQSQHNWRQSGA